MIKKNSIFKIDESSGILRNVDCESSNTEDSNQSGRINYDKMDEINNKAENNSINFTMDMSSTDHSTKSEITYVDEKINKFSKTFSPEPDTAHVNQSSSNKISASLNLTGIDDTVACLKKLSISKADNNGIKNDTTLNFSSNLSDRMEQLIQQSVERVKRIGQTHLLNNYAEDYLNLMSRPGKENRYSTSTVQSDTKNASLNFSQNIPLTPSKTFNQTLEPQEEPKIVQDNTKNSHNPFDDTIQNCQTSIGTQSNPFENPFDNSLGNFGLKQNLESSFAQFKQADDFLDQLKQDEQINRKEFADNELTLNQTSNTSSNDSNSSKWWKNPNQIQPNNLEVTNLSSESGSKKKLKVEEFFMGKSELPSYLTEKQCDVRLSDDDKIEKDSCVEKKSDKEPTTPQNYDDITFSYNQGSSLSSSNFSFTLNSSDTGEFIQPKKSSNKSLNKSTEKSSQGSKKLKNLEKINEELDKVQNRLANKHQISEPLMSSSMSQANRKSLMHMDETISSINSSDVLSQRTTKHKEHKSTKDSKKSSGSLTSTPSKMTKSISESSNLNRLTGNSLMEKFYKSENQDSFISSIPERNESTLVSNKQRSNKIVKKQKNAEIQTAEENRQSISNVSSTSSTSSDPSNTMNNQFNMINNLAAAVINNSTNSTNQGNGLVPVAFIPLNSFIPCVQKFYDDMQTTQGI